MIRVATIFVGCSSDSSYEAVCYFLVLIVEVGMVVPSLGIVVVITVLIVCAKVPTEIIIEAVVSISISNSRRRRCNISSTRYK